MMGIEYIGLRKKDSGEANHEIISFHLPADNDLKKGDCKRFHDVKSHTRI